MHYYSWKVKPVDYSLSHIDTAPIYTISCFSLFHKRDMLDTVPLSLITSHDKIDETMAQFIVEHKYGSQTQLAAAGPLSTECI